MARARNIKPGFFDNEVLGEMPPLARLLFIGLWCLADREGRLYDRPKRIKKELLGYDDITADDVDNMLRELCDNEFIIRYQVANEHYIQIINFLKHQNPHLKEKESEIPPVPNNINQQYTEEQRRDSSRCDITISCKNDVSTDCQVKASESSTTPVTKIENADIKDNKIKNIDNLIKAPYKHGARTVQAPYKHGARTRKALLNPDSLIPDILNHDKYMPNAGALGDTEESQSLDKILKENQSKQERKAKTTDTVDKRFGKFWAVYPKRVGKAMAKKAWDKLKPSEELLEKMIKTLGEWSVSEQWTRDKGKYIPYPATWLNRGGWEDEIQRKQEVEYEQDRSNTSGFCTKSEY